MNKFCLPFILILILGCASIRYPEGGPKDEEPPLIKTIQPDLPKTRFNEKKIELKFNEYIRNEDYTKEILFSPPLKTPAKVLTYGKKIKIILPNNLDNDLTYLLTIGKNIKDFNEGNTLRQIQQFPFTKSNEFDTCSVYGELIKTHPKMKLDNFMVFLYDQDSISSLNFHNQIPMYFGLVNENYQYKVSYVKPGKYKILAVQDKNNDYKFNDGENIGIDEQITIDLNKNFKQEFDLYCFPNDVQAPKIKKSYWKDSINYWFEFSEPIIKDSLKIQASTNCKFIANEQKLEIYFPEPIKDSLNIKLWNVLDTLGNSLDTVFNFALNKTNAYTRTFQIEKPEITPKYWTFKANTVLQEKNLLYIKVLDSLQKVLPLPIYVNDNIIKIDVKDKVDTGQVYTVLIDSLFLSYQNQKLDSTLLFKIKPKSEDEFYGYLKISIQCDYPNFLGFLKNTQTKEIKVFNDKNLIFNELNPGKYQIVLIDDEDGNGLWSTGNLNTLKLPEDIYIYPQEIEIKPQMKIENLEIKVQ